jgi:hypothetical protein
MPNPRWTYNVPGPIREDIPGRDLNSGHPTAPGPNDPSLIAVKQADGTYNYVQARGRLPVREGAKNIGNGVPATSRLTPAPKNTNPIPGEFGRPIQPGTNYNNGSDVSGP